MTNGKILTVPTTCSGNTHVTSVINGAVGRATGQEITSRLSWPSKWNRCVPEEGGSKEKARCAGELEERVRSEGRGEMKWNSKPVSGVGALPVTVKGFKDQVGSSKAFITAHMSCSLMYPSPWHRD